MVILAILLPWLVPMTVACGISAVIAWLKTRRNAARARARVQDRAATADGVVIHGRLRVEGDGLADEGQRRWRTGKKLAAASLIHSLSRCWPRNPRPDGEALRCDKLWLDLEEGSLRLEGPLLVEAGSRQRWDGTHVRDGAGKWFLGEFALFDGDVVAVAGVRGSGPPSGAGEKRYRESAASQVLSPLPTGAIALAAARSTASFDVRGWLRLPAVLGVAVASLVPSCGSWRDYSETKEHCDELCERSGQCAVGLKPWSRLVAAGKRALMGEVYQCVAPDDGACQRSSQCPELGWCTERDGDCAATDEHCRFTHACLTTGRCQAKNGQCAALSDEDCRQLESCASYGFCIAKDGRCVAARDEDCASSELCRTLGQCSAEGNSCVVAKDEDCARSEYCETLGHCSARGGWCTLATSADCRRTSGCRSSGECTFADGACRVASDADCALSNDCATWTRCRAEAGKCVSDGPCGSSAACRVHGRCGGTELCSPASADDCERSVSCKERGACRHISGTCVESCAALEGCKQRGKCSAFDIEGGTHCRAANDEDCRGSAACTFSGMCSAVEGRCVARSEADCSRSAACRTRGECTHKEDGCVAAGDDCLASNLCRSIGECAAVDGRCVAGRADERCRGTAACERLGRCKWVSYECTVGHADDCKQSEACRVHGWCEKVGEICGPKKVRF